MRNDKLIKSLILIAGSIRLILFFVFYFHVTLFPDSQGYIDLSERLSQFYLAGYNGQRSPGYPLLISLAFENLYLVVFYQFILGLGTTVLWYKTLLKLHFSGKVSFLISLGLTALLDVLFFETTILVESVTLFFMTLTIYLLTCNYFDSRSYKKEMKLGVVLGMLTLVKPFYAFLPFLIFGIFLLYHFQWKSLMSRKLLIFICPLIAYFGWSEVNQRNTGYFVSTTFFGLNIAQNCVRFAEKGPEEYQWISKPYVQYREKSKRESRNIAMAIWDAYEGGAYDQYNLSFADFSYELGQYGKATIKANPWDYSKQVAISWRDFWKPSIHWNYKGFNFKYANKGFLLLWYIQSVFLWIFRLTFLLLIPYHLFKAIKNRKITIEFTLMAFVFSASILQALVTYGTNSRFSFPFEFMMIFLVFCFLKEKKLFGLR